MMPDLVFNSFNACFLRSVTLPSWKEYIRFMGTYQQKIHLLEDAS